MRSSTRSSTRSDARHARHARHARQRGQATVELALTLPFIALALLLVVQVLLIAEGQLAVQHAAREAARVAAVDPDPAAATAAATTGPIPAAGTRVAVEPPRDGRVRVTVTHRLPTDVPLVGPLLPDIDLRADATFRVEWLPP